MVSLNDLEAQIAALGGQTSADLDGDSDDAEDAGEEKDESSSASSEETTDAAAKARAKARAAVAKAMAAEIEEGDDVISTKKKPVWVLVAKLEKLKETTKSHNSQKGIVLREKPMRRYNSQKENVQRKGLQQPCAFAT